MKRTAILFYSLAAVLFFSGRVCIASTFKISNDQVRVIKHEADLQVTINQADESVQKDILFLKTIFYFILIGSIANLYFSDFVSKLIIGDKSYSGSFANAPPM